MVQWVEKGIAPSEVDATDTIGSTTVSRPVYPYPDIPKYNGNDANPALASSFHPVISPDATAQYTDWIGNYLFYQPIGGRSDRGTRHY